MNKCQLCERGAEYIIIIEYVEWDRRKDVFIEKERSIKTCKNHSYAFGYSYLNNADGNVTKIEIINIKKDEIERICCYDS